MTFVTDVGRYHKGVESLLLRIDQEREYVRLVRKKLLTM